MPQTFSKNFQRGQIFTILLDYHFHLLLQTPEANLSRAFALPCHWLNVGHSGWFNRRHQRVGHLFQGRF